MTFRRRLLLACAAAVAAAVAMAAVLAYVVVRDTLRGQIDDSLRAATRIVPADGPLAGAAGGQSRVTVPAPQDEAGDVIMLQALRAPVLFTQVFSGDALPEHPVPGGPGPLVSDAALRALAAAGARRSSPSATTRAPACACTPPRSDAVAPSSWRAR